MTWARCTEGHLHWGVRGAAGLLLTDAGRVLLQLRAPSVHQGGTWSVPGGAREPGETFTEAALREAREECGLDPADVATGGTYTSTCGSWPYVTVTARPLRDVALHPNGESARLEWVDVDEVADLPLHPAFAEAWAGGLREATLRQMPRDYKMGERAR